MARVITGLAPTTELEVINGMLASIGEAPVLQAEIESPTLNDTTMALNILRDTTRESLGMGWRFNTEFGFEVQPEVATYAWTGSDSSTATLYVFLQPSDLLAFELTPISKQLTLEVGIRPARDETLTEGSDRVFYDKNENRDGFEDSDLQDTALFIDGVFLMDFEDCPESFRRYVQVKATRRFQASVMGSDKLDRFVERDEYLALRNLKRDQGRQERFNIFRGMRMVSGRYRRPTATGRLSDTNSPRP